MKFEQVLTKARSKCSFLTDRDCTKIFIASLADNTTASGIFAAIQAEIERRSLAAKAIATGSCGYYDLEPIIRIEKPGCPSILYKNISPEAASALVNDYLITGNPRPDLALCSIGDERIDGIPEMSGIPLFKLQSRLALRNCGNIDPENINHYIVLGQGYSGLARAWQMKPAQVVAELKKSVLRGRGGAGYSTADKWEICRYAEGSEKYVICNAVDADPESRTARLILESDPHSVLEGILIGAYAVGASRCSVCVSAENKHGIKRLAQALEQMREYSLLGGNILDSIFSCEIEIKEVESSFVLGEETALIRLLEEKQAIPYIRTAYPAASGLHGKPTLINNIETFANVPAVFQSSPEKWHGGTGTEESRGSKVMTLAGNIVHRYTIEVPFGTTLCNIITEIGGGVADGNRLKAVQFGGPTGAFFAADSLDTPIDYETMEKAAAIIGSGTVEVFSSDSCAVEMVREVIHYLQTQSCGKCVFCREGIYQMYDILKDISGNTGRPDDLDLLVELSEAMKTGSICGLGSTAPNPVLSSISLFGDDYDAHIKDKRCPANGTE